MWGAAVKRGNKTGNRNRKLTKLVKIVPFECEITHANYGGDRTAFVKVMGKKLMHPSSWTRDWLPSVLILRGLWLRENIDVLASFLVELFNWSLL